MKTRLSSLLTFFGLLLAAQPAAATKDITITALEPNGSARINIGVPTVVSITVKNVGDETADTVGLRMSMVGLDGVIYDDSTTIYNLLPGASLRVALDDLVIQSNDPFEITATVSLTGDEQIGNNRTGTNNAIGIGRDIEAIAVVDPAPDGSVPQKLGFRPKGTFMSYWFEEYNEPVRVEIRRCSDNGLVYRADTTLVYIPGKSKLVTQIFPAAQNGWDTRSLSTGCYRVAMIARKSTDNDRTNDTAYATFTVTSHKLAYDVTVDTASGPKAPSPYPLNAQIPMQFSYTNIGTVEVNNVKVYAEIENSNEQVIYRDTAVIANWPVGQSISKTFKTFTAASETRYYLKTYTTLSSDQDRYDDTLNREFYVKDVSTFSVVKIFTPVHGAVVIGGSAFVPAARYRWVGNLIAPPDATARMTINSLDAPRTITLDAPILGVNYSNQEVDVIFPTSNGSTSTKDLPKGRYHAIATITGSSAASVTNEFTIAYLHDVTIDSILTPLSESYSALPIPLKYRIANIGLSKETDIRLEATIRNVYDSIIYQKYLTDVTVNLNGKRILPFPDLEMTSKGVHTVTVRASMLEEGDESDNVLSYGFHYGPSLKDIAVTAPVSPMPNAVIKQGTRFDLKAIGEWFGGDVLGNASIAEISIQECGSGTEVYYSSDLINIARREVITLPTTYLGKSVRDIPAGCYRAHFRVSHPDDLDTSDNNLVVPFEIKQSATIAGHNDILPSTYRIIQTGGNIEVDLERSVSGDWVLYDGIGRAIANGALDRQTTIDIPTSMLLSGTYHLEFVDPQSRSRVNFAFNYVR